MVIPPKYAVSKVVKTIKKKYKALNSLRAKVIFNNEKNIKSEPYDTFNVQQLLPHEEDMSYDMAMNILYFEPGIGFGAVENHIMEHGLYMLEGTGVYWLNGDYQEVLTNDYIIWHLFAHNIFIRLV